MMRSIELFTGAGGLALGTHRAGFNHFAVVELNHDACDTLRLNVRRGIEGIDWRVEKSNIHGFDYSRFSTEIALLAAGAPCQPFSLGGKHAGESDERNLFPEVFRAVRELRPRAFLLENVRGLTRKSFKPYFDYILLQLGFPHVEQLVGEDWRAHRTRLEEYAAAKENVAGTPWNQPAENRYDVACHVIDVADYGVPQRRHRVFIIGFRGDLGVRWSPPTPMYSQDALIYAQYVDGSYWREHELKARPTPAKLANRVDRLAATGRPSTVRWRTVRDAIRDLPEPVMREPHPQYDNHVGIPDAKAYIGHTGSPWDSPAKTIKAGDHGNPGGENMLADDDGSVRYFTVRELARLQTFPDDWHFSGPWSESRRQLGNAVPVLMAEALANRIRFELERATTRNEVRKTERLLVASD